MKNYTPRRVSGTGGSTAVLSSSFQYSPRELHAVGLLELVLTMTVTNGGLAAVDFDPQPVASGLFVTVRTHVAYVCNNVIAWLLTCAAVVKELRTVAALQAFDAVSVGIGETKAITIRMPIPFADARSARYNPDDEPDGELYGMELSEVTAEAANLMASQHADLSLVSWSLHVVTHERPVAAPFIGAIHEIRDVPIQDAIQKVEGGFIVDAALYNTAGTDLSANVMQIRTAGEILVPNSGLEDLSRALEAQDDDGFQLNAGAGTAFFYVHHAPAGYGVPTRPQGTLWIENLTNNWPANTRLLSILVRAHQRSYVTPIVAMWPEGIMATVNTAKGAVTPQASIAAGNASAVVFQPLRGRINPNVRLNPGVPAAKPGLSIAGMAGAAASGLKNY